MMFGTSVGALGRPFLEISPLRPAQGHAAAAWRWLLAALLVIAAPALAQAQVENATPFYVAVERDGVALQCRIGSASYPVKVLKAGEILRVDGQSQSIYRVEYPAGMSAFTKVEEAVLEEGGKTVKLTKPSRLMAPNSEGGVSWWYLLEKELDAGTKFAYQKTVKGPDGKDSGYLVPAPAGSKAYIRRDFVRAATQAEVDKHLGKTTPETKPAEPKPANPTPAVTPPATAPATAPTTPSATPTSTPAKPTGTPPAPPATGTKPPETKPAGETPAQPTTTPTTPTTPPDATPVPPVDAPPAPAPTPPRQPRKIVEAETLTKLYTDAVSKRADQVELEPVIAEFERTIESLKKEEGTERLRQQLDRRLQVLKMRAELQAALRQTGTSSDALKQQSDQMKAELKRLESLRQYTVVGRLVASSVYDGKQLPLMYRVLSPEPTSTRTLAYVAPEANSDLTDKAGKIVGVVGESKFDESLRVNIVTPTRVDVLGVVPSPATAPPGAPAPASTTSAPPAPAPAASEPAKPADDNK